MVLLLLLLILVAAAGVAAYAAAVRSKRIVALNDPGGRRRDEREIGLEVLTALRDPLLADDGERLLGLLQRLRGTAFWNVHAEVLHVHALGVSNQVEPAAAAALELRYAVAELRLGWVEINTLVNVLVTAGRYSEAIGLFESVPNGERCRARGARDPDFALVELNLAEAEMNLGHADEACARLAPLDASLTHSALGRAGLAMQRMFILGALGRGDDALAAAGDEPRQALGHRFAAEYHLSWAYALLAVGRLDEADHHLTEALACAVRPASTRNGLFLRGRVAAARGDCAAADRACAEAAAHPHRWQGGDGLLFWARLLRDRGEPERAASAFALAVERDPQSASASVARSELASMAVAGNKRCNRC